METIGLSINGKKLTCPAGISVLEAATANGFHIPTLCHHPDLRPHGACRLCTVEDAASGRLSASCVTPVAEGMAVLTHSPRVVAHRKTIVSLIMAAHPESCLICAKGNDCELRNVASELGLGRNTLYPMPKYSPQDQSNPFIYRDISKCILCGKCIRGCKELVVSGILDYSDRGFLSKPQTVFDTPLALSDCTFCGTCVSLCPTGALVPSSAVYTGTADRRTESVCGFCGSGCRVSLGISQNRIRDVKPSESKDSANGVTLCVRGHFALDYLGSDRRLRSARLRTTEGFVPVPVSQAIAELVQRLTAIRDQHGPASIGFYGSSKCSNEENFLFQKIARLGIGTAHIDNGGAVYGRENMARFDALTWGRFRRQPMADLEKAQVIMVIGAEPSSSAPVLGYHIKRAAKKGTVVVVLNQRKGDETRLGALWLKPPLAVDMAGSYAKLIQAVTVCFLKENNMPLSGNLDFQDLVTETGVDGTLIRQAASLIQGKRVSFVLGEDILDSRNAMTAMSACVDLVGILKSSGPECSGVHLIARENNLIGSWDMGTVPDQLPGRNPADNQVVHRDFENSTGSRLPDFQGLSIRGMLDAAEQGRLKALFILGENPLRALPQRDKVQKALAKLEFLIVQDILDTETTALAHLVLPGASFAEKEGSFTSMEGRVQMFSRAVEPPGEAKSDLDLLRLIAEGLGVKAGDLGELRQEIEQRVPAYTGLSRNRHYFWPDWERQEKNIIPAFSNKGVTMAPAENNAYPYTAVTCSTFFHAGCGTRTACSMRISQAPIREHLVVSPRLALRHSFEQGNTVKVVSEHGAVTRQIVLDPAMDDHIVMVPTAVCGNDGINLFGMESHNTTRCRVKIEKT